jgi:hypothetical protein
MSGRYGAVTLHEELRAILEEHGNPWMSTASLADEVNRRGRYHKGDGSDVTDFQVHGRTRNYTAIFERDGTRVRLRDRPSTPIDEPDQSPHTSAITDLDTDDEVEVDLVEIAATLTGPGARAAEAAVTLPHLPGLYAFHGDGQAWRELGLGEPPDERPLYVGKSESSLLKRDVDTHFSDGRTGSSTLRRSLAGLLRDSLGLRGMPRNPAKPGYYSSFGLSPGHDAVLTEWMRDHLTIATWAAPRAVALVSIEGDVLRRLLPPLNLHGVTTSWSSLVSAGRAVMAKEARAWTASQKLG